MTRGRGGVSQKGIFDDEGGRGGPDPPKKDGIIYEQPLTYCTYNQIKKKTLKWLASLPFSISKTNHCLMYIVLNTVQYNAMFIVLCILMYTILDSL